MNKIGNKNKINQSIIGNNNKIQDNKQNIFFNAIITIITGIIVAGIIYYLGWN